MENKLIYHFYNKINPFSIISFIDIFFPFSYEGYISFPFFFGLLYMYKIQLVSK
jgi:hypothetical protein